MENASPSRPIIETLELLNMDLRDIGGVSLPDLSVIKKSSYLQGPKILQVASVRDISQSSVEVAVNSFQHRNRLLRFSLTDGHSEVIAIEYKTIPSITDVIVPGTKVLLQHKTPIHSGIVCLDSVTLTVLGGVVQTLYEEWEVNQKYSGFARSSLRLPKTIDDDGGPPQFEKLQINSPNLRNISSNLESTSTSTAATLVKLNESSSQRQMSDKMEDKSTTASVSGKGEEKSTLESRPKEVAEALPVQNQAAAQKLLQKMSQSHRDGKQSRGPKYKGKGKPEDPVVFTLDEWEKRKGGTKTVANANFADTSQDEELAWRLQNQLDMEECNVRRGPGSDAEQIRMNMFNFGRAEEGKSDGRREFSGRGGRGRGRGRRRFG
ncbi:uncharacterized protein [Aristolochia californica]|uniref:uncharacterized protein isoform X2 n=1 Tax=Aristolochia californica TaxID=171875 RepID=UPI0035D816F9